MTDPLITPEILARQPSQGLVILDARTSAAEFGAGHLCGAVRADLERDLSAASDAGADPAAGGRHPLPPIGRWLALVGSWGIEPLTHVVIYDDQGGANAAARAWWMLRSIGHERVSLLDGGYAAAVAAGLPTTTDAPVTTTRPPYPAEGWQWPTAGIDAVDRLREDPSWKLLDVRSAPRFRGETEPFDPIAGHIPGAVNLFFGENLEGGRFRSSEALREQYRGLLGGTPPERLVVHCGSGVTACHTLFALDVAGIHGAALYVGSWGEWCRSDRPRATGS